MSLYDVVVGKQCYCFLLLLLLLLWVSCREILEFGLIFLIACEYIYLMVAERKVDEEREPWRLDFFIWVFSEKMTTREEYRDLNIFSEDFCENLKNGL